MGVGVQGLTLIDLAFPRDVDPCVATIPGVKLFNLEDVESRIRNNLFLRKEEIDKAEQIIRQEAARLQESLERRKLYL